MTNDRVLVAGGAGFIGVHLIETLLKRGREVVCIDNLSSGTRENLSLFANSKAFSFIEHDITQPITIECNEIYNLACPASPKFYARDPKHTLETCFNGSLNLLKLAKRNNARILFTSTSEIYGDPEVTPQPEEYRGSVDTFCERSCYDEGKRVAETLFSIYLRKGIDVRVCRLFNVYGPRMRDDDGRVVPNFIKQAIANKPFTIQGDGKQTRSFCYIDDTIRGILKLMATAGVNVPVNIGNPNEITVMQLAQTIKSLINSGNEFEYMPLPNGDPKRRMPDISKAKRLLNWEPKIGLVEGLLKTIEFFKMSH